MSKQETDSKNPAHGWGTDNTVGVKGKTGMPESKGETDKANPRDDMTGISGGDYAPTKTSY